MLPICESIVKLSAICALCYEPAAFSKRIVDDDRIELIGSSDMYIPCCRKCHLGPGTMKPKKVIKEASPEDDSIIAEP